MKAQTERSPSTLTKDELAARTLHRRAVEAVIWGMPAVNAELMFQAMARCQSRFQSAHLLVEAGHFEKSDSYTEPRHHLPQPYYNTKDGPIVLEIPAGPRRRFDNRDR